MIKQKKYFANLFSFCSKYLDIFFVESDPDPVDCRVVESGQPGPYCEEASIIYNTSETVHHQELHYCFYDSRSKKVHNLTFTSPLSIVTTNHKDKDKVYFLLALNVSSFAHTSVMSVTVRAVKISKNKNEVSNSASP